MKFSKTLISNTKEYFRKHSGIELTDTEANTYIEKLGALGLLVCDLSAAAPRPAGPRIAEENHGSTVVISKARGRHFGGVQPVTLHPQTPVDGDS